MSQFGTQLLDVAIGLVFLYVIVSLMASAIVEAIESLLRTRAKYLWQGVTELLGAAAKSSGKAGVVNAASLYEHPLVGSLYFGSYPDATRRLVRRRLPSYIPRESFSAAVIDLVSRSARSDAGASSIETLRRGIRGLPDNALRRALETITRVAGDDILSVQRGIEQWYDASMDRVSGWYKRHAQLMLLIVGFTLAAAANIDSWHIARDLAADEPKRQALIDAAGAFIQSREGQSGPVVLDDVRDYLAAAGSSLLPTERGLHSVPGWLVTAFAVSLGAPFWFDLLNKMMVIRSTVKPREKSRDEGSEDRMTIRARTVPLVYMKRG